MMWSWVLALCGITGTFIVGRKSIYGWVVLFINETLWIFYALNTRQYGFILGSLSYMVVYTYNYKNWKESL